MEWNLLCLFGWDKKLCGERRHSVWICDAKSPYWRNICYQIHEKLFLFIFSNLSMSTYVCLRAWFQSGETIGYLGNFELIAAICWFYQNYTRVFAHTDTHTRTHTHTSTEACMNTSTQRHWEDYAYPPICLNQIVRIHSDRNITAIHKWWTKPTLFPIINFQIFCLYFIYDVVYWLNSLNRLNTMSALFTLGYFVRRHELVDPRRIFTQRTCLNNSSKISNRKIQLDFPSFSFLLPVAWLFYVCGCGRVCVCVCVCVLNRVWIFIQHRVKCKLMHGCWRENLKGRMSFKHTAVEWKSTHTALKGSPKLGKHKEISH